MKLQTGVFALLDCLGFRGKWNQGEEQLLSKLQTISETLDQALKDPDQPWMDGQTLMSALIRNEIQLTHRSEIGHSLRLLSDTVAIGLQPPEDWEVEDQVQMNQLLVYTMCRYVVHIGMLYLEMSPPLLLRGCIALGKFCVTHNFLVGPAVDEAAESYDVAQGAFVRLLPAAARAFDKFTSRPAMLADS